MSSLLPSVKALKGNDDDEHVVVVVVVVVVTPVGGLGIVFAQFLSSVCFFVCFFVSNITRKRLDRFA